MTAKVVSLEVLCWTGQCWLQGNGLHSFPRRTSQAFGIHSGVPDHPGTSSSSSLMRPGCRLCRACLRYAATKLARDRSVSSPEDGCGNRPSEATHLTKSSRRCCHKRSLPKARPAAQPGQALFKSRVASTSNFPWRCRTRIRFNVRYNPSSTLSGAAVTLGSVPLVSWNAMMRSADATGPPGIDGRGVEVIPSTLTQTSDTEPNRPELLGR